MTYQRSINLMTVVKKVIYCNISGNNLDVDIYNLLL